jgi:hypothetical protein
MPMSGHPWPWFHLPGQQPGIPRKMDQTPSSAGERRSAGPFLSEFMSMPKDIARAKSIVRLSNISRTPPVFGRSEPDLPGHADEVRPLFGHRRL